MDGEYCEEEEECGNYDDCEELVALTKGNSSLASWRRYYWHLNNHYMNRDFPSLGQDAQLKERFVNCSSTVVAPKISSIVALLRLSNCKPLNTRVHIKSVGLRRV